MKRKIVAGFTLIEIVIALTVFTIGIIAILSLFMLGFDAAMRSTDLTKAGIYGQYVMEDIKRAGFPVTAVATWTAFPGGFDSRFTYKVDVVTNPAGYETVTVIVRWDYKGTTYNEIFVTNIADYTP